MIRKLNFTCFRVSNRMAADIKNTIRKQWSREMTNFFVSSSIATKNNASNHGIICVEKVEFTIGGDRNVRRRVRSMSIHSYSELKISLHYIILIK